MKPALIQDYISTQCNKLNIPGLSCSVSWQNTLNTYSFGKSNLEQNTPVTAQSVFNIASVGKLLTVVIVFKLIEQGRLSLSSAIGNLLPDLPVSWKDIQISHLLSHSSGIRNYTDIPAYWQECRLDVPKSRIIEYVSSIDPDFEAGTQWTYSNTGFYLLGLIAEKISGMDYFNLAGQIISDYKPGLGIVATNLRGEMPALVNGYTYLEKELANVPYYSNSGTFSAGGFSAILRDFLDFENALFNGKILSESSVQAITIAFVKADGLPLKSPDADHDFEMTHGLFRFKKQGKICLCHRGEIPGFSTDYMRVLDDNFSVIISVNIDNRPEVYELADMIYKLTVSNH